MKFIRDGLGLAADETSDGEIGALMDSLDLGGDGNVGADDLADFMATDFVGGSGAERVLTRPLSPNSAAISIPISESSDQAT